MYNHIRHLQSFLSQMYQTALQESEILYSLTGYIEVTAQTHLSNTTVRYLYVIKNKEDVHRLDVQEHMCFCYLTDDLEDPLFETEPAHPYTLLKVKTAKADKVIELIQQHFDIQNGRSQWSDTLLSILFSESGLRELVKEAYTIFLNPIYLFNPEFRLLLSSEETKEDPDPLGKKFLLNNGMSQEEVQLLNSCSIFQKLNQEDCPLYINDGRLPCPIIIGKIDFRKDMGYFIIAEHRHKIQSIQLQLAFIMQTAINQQFKKDAFIRKNNGMGHEFLLRDILDGRYLNGTNYKKKVDYLTEEYFGNFFCLVIEISHSSSFVNTTHLRALFETKYRDAMSLVYEDALVVILRYRNKTDFQQQEIKHIQKICVEYGVYAGISNCFQNLYDLRVYYEQARLCVKLGLERSTTPSVFEYKNYVLDHVMTVFRNKESVDAFIHPKLKQLLDYDKANNKNYVGILYQYLIHERNINETAKALFVHRNTMLYYLKKIDTIVSLNLENYLERQHLLLSYELVCGKSGSRTNLESDNRVTEQLQGHVEAKTQIGTSLHQASFSIDDKILQIIQEQNDISQRKIAEQIGESYAAVRYHMEQLKKKGVIVYTGTNRGGAWMIFDA